MATATWVATSDQDAGQVRAGRRPAAKAGSWSTATRPGPGSPPGTILGIRKRVLLDRGFPTGFWSGFLALLWAGTCAMVLRALGRAGAQDGGRRQGLPARGLLALALMPTAFALVAFLAHAGAMGPSCSLSALQLLLVLLLSWPPALLAGPQVLSWCMRWWTRLQRALLARRRRGARGSGVSAPPRV